MFVCGMFLETPWSGDTRLVRAEFEPRSFAPNVIPWGSRAYENVHLHFYPWVAINATQRHSVNFIAMSSTECGPTRPTEAQAPTGTRLMADNAILTRCPCKRPGLNLGVCRACAAKRLPASRTVTASRRFERRVDLVPNLSAKTTAS